MVDEAIPSVQDAGSSISRRDLVLLCGGLLFCLLVYLLYLDPVAGMMVDDGWYALLAKALATGRGYGLINSPSEGIFPLYPPAYPFILSIIFRILPEFPGNVWALKTVSVLSMLGLGVISYLYFRGRSISSSLALVVVLAALLCQPLLFLASSTLMSECFFALLIMAQLFFTERLVRRAEADGEIDRAALVFSSLLAVLAFLTRSIAAGWIAGVALYLLRKRQLKLAIGFVVMVGALAGPWTLYSAMHAPTPAQRLEQGGHIVLPYQEQLWQRIAGASNLGRITPAELPARVLGNLHMIAGSDTARIVVTPLFQWLYRANKSFVPVLSGLLALLVLAGYLAAVRGGATAVEYAAPLMLLLVLLWPFETARFMMPLAPMVFYYLFRGSGYLLEKARPTIAQGLVLKFAVVILVVGLIGHAMTLRNLYFSSELERSGWSASFEDVKTMTLWIGQHIPKSGVIACNNPPLLHLLTGNPTIGSEITPERWELFKRLNVRYVAYLRYEGNPVDYALRNYQTVYLGRNMQNFRIVDLGPPESRPPLIQ